MLPKDKKCGSCHFCRDNDCRRYPPVLVPHMIVDHGTGRSFIDEYYPEYPFVGEGGNPCGEFIDKEDYTQ